MGSTGLYIQYLQILMSFILTDYKKLVYLFKKGVRYVKESCCCSLCSSLCR